MDILQTKAYNFALRVARLAEHLNNQKKEFVLSRKILDSGTNIGLLIEEGKQGEDRTDFIQKYAVANKEAFRSHFLLRLLRDCEFITSTQAESPYTIAVSCKACLFRRFGPRERMSSVFSFHFSVFSFLEW